MMSPMKPPTAPITPTGAAARANTLRSGIIIYPSFFWRGAHFGELGFYIIRDLARHDLAIAITRTSFRPEN